MPGNAKRRPGGGSVAAQIGKVESAESSAPPAGPQGLADLAAAIRAEHEAAGAAASTALEHAIRCGDLLIQAKATVGHGGWLPWLGGNCSLRPRTAQAYMRLARELPKLPARDAQRVADLSVRDAIAQLGQHARQLAKLPAATAAEVLDQAEDRRLRDPLVYAHNQHKPPPRYEPTAWTSIELPPALPPPDRDLAERIAALIDESGLDPITVQETLNFMYCEHQKRHQLVTPYGPPAQLDDAA